MNPATQEFSGKVVFVTGAGAGNGQAMPKDLSADVHIIGIGVHCRFHV